MDFSNRIRSRNTPGPAGGPAPAADSRPASASGPGLGALLQSKPLLVALAIVAGLAFSLGVMAGVPIGRVQQQEQDVSARVNKRKAENGDKKSGSAKPGSSGSAANGGSMSINSMANRGNSDNTGSTSTGSNRLMNPSHNRSGAGPNNGTPGTPSRGTGSASYVITLGTYSSGNARKLLMRINRLPEIARMRPAPCRTLEETVPNRAPGFRLRHPSNKRLNRVYLGCFHREADAQRALRAIRDSRVIPLSHAKLILF